MFAEDVYDKLKIIEKKIDSFLEVTSWLMNDENLCGKCASDSMNSSKSESENLDENGNEQPEASGSGTTISVATNTSDGDDDIDYENIDEADSTLCEEFRQMLISIDSYNADESAKTLRTVMKIMQTLKTNKWFLRSNYSNKIKDENAVDELAAEVDPNEALHPEED